MASHKVKAKVKLPKQFVGKKGVDEDPTSIQIASMGKNLKENEAQYDQLLRFGTKHLASARKSCEDMHGLADMYLAYCETPIMIHEEEMKQSTAQKSLRLSSDFIHTSQHRKADQLRDFDSKVLVQLRKFKAEGLAQAKEQKKKHYRLFDKMEYARNEMETAKNNKKVPQEKKKEKEDAFTELKGLYEESKYDTHSLFLDVSTQNDLIIAQSMLDSFEIFQQFHLSCAKWLEEKMAQVEELKTKLREEKETAAAQRMARAAHTPSQLRLLVEKNAFFGTPLDRYLLKDRERGIDCVIPMYIKKMIDWLVVYGLKEEGIFRISGNQTHVKEWTDRINRGENIDLILDKKADPHLLCSLIKQYLRELPEPICPVSMYPVFLEFAKKVEEKKTIAECQSLLFRLPPNNYYLLREIMMLTHHVVKHKGHNKMSASNMGTVMAPNIFRVEQEFSMDEMKLTCDLYGYLSDNYLELFEDDPQFLIKAVKIQQIPFIRELLKTDKMDPNLKEKETGNSVLNVLIGLENPSLECINLLVECGADLDMVGGDGLPPVFRAVAPQPAKRAALIRLIELGAKTSEPYVVDGKERILIEHVAAVDPAVAEEIQQAISLASPGSMTTSPRVTISNESTHGSIDRRRSTMDTSQAPVKRGLPPRQKSTEGAVLIHKPQQRTSQPRLQQGRAESMMSGSLSPLRERPTSSPPNSPQFSPSSPSRASPFSTPLPAPLVSPSGRTPPGSPMLSPSSPHISTPPHSARSESGIVSIPPVYRRIALDPLIEALGKVVMAGCRSSFQQQAVEQTNAALAQVAQPLKQMFSQSSENSLWNFSGGFPDSSKQVITDAGKNLQDSAKRMVQSARKVYAEKSDASQGGFAGELNYFVSSIRQLVAACDRAGFDVIMTEAQSLTKCLSEVISYVKTGTDPQGFKEIGSSATRAVLQFNQLVKTRALQVPDRDIQSKLSRSCAQIAQTTADLSRSSLVLMSSPPEFRNLEPVGTKAKAIISELHAINSVVRAPIPDLYLMPPSDDVVAELERQGESSMEQACFGLERAGEDEVLQVARETLPSFLRALYVYEFDRRERMEKILNFVDTIRGAVARMEEVAGGNVQHKIVVFTHALEHLCRLAVVSVASYCAEPYGAGAGDYLVPSLAYILQQLGSCFQQLVGTVFPE